MRFDGKVLLATGGGSGIAAAVARRFAAEGGRVAVVDQHADRAHAVASELDGSIAIVADVTDERSVVEAVAATAQQLGRLDCLLNAAGYADFGPIEEWTLERFNRMISVHLGGTFLFCKHAIPHLRERGGSIVNVSSIGALVAQPGNAPYGAAKAAILSFSRQIALDLAPHIRVNAVAPGRVRTGMTTPVWVERGGGDFAKGAALAAAFNPFKRVAEPEEIAAPICFLLSDEASFMTGTLLVPDGGETAI